MSRSSVNTEAVVQIIKVEEEVSTIIRCRIFLIRHNIPFDVDDGLDRLRMVFDLSIKTLIAKQYQQI